MPRDEATMTSSPDPLGMPQDTPLTISPAKVSRKITTPRKALNDATGNVRLQEFYLTTPPGTRVTFSSPNKTTAQTQNQLSPWRIHVTVQAEREDAEDASPSKKPSPTKRFAQHTTTTTVPLKGADDSSPAAAKKGRGRPRKSLDVPEKRNGTPKPKAVARRKTVPVLVEKAANDKPAQATLSKGSRGRPRKSLEANVEESKIQKDGAGKQTPTRPRSKGRRKAMTPLRFEGNSDSASIDASSGGFDEGTTRGVESLTEIQEPTSTNRGRPKRKSLEKIPSFTAQSDPTGHVGSGQYENSTCTVDDPVDWENSSYGEAALDRSLADQIDEDMWRSMIRQDNVSPVHRRAESHSHDEDTPDEDDLVEPISDPTDEHNEYDSILESEGFSMVSVSSLPSARQQSSSPVVYEEEQQENPSAVAEAETPGGSLSSSITKRNEGSSERGRLSVQQNSATQGNISVSEMPSSPPIPKPLQAYLPVQRQTPSIASSSPSLPPPLASPRPHLSPRTVDKPTDSTPKLVRVVRAGIALQGVLSPKNTSDKPSSETIPTQAAQSSSSTSSAKSPRERLDDMFSGFGAGTRRELRAGLRLGEELAKRQQAIGKKKIPKATPEDDVFSQETGPSYPVLPSSSVKREYSLRLPGSGKLVEYPELLNDQLPSPARSEPDDADSMSWKEDTPVRLEVPTLASAQANLNTDKRANDDAAYDETMMRREAEWQREREAVSKQIEMASTSQVVVINSDDEEDTQQEELEDDNEDIWQTEANSSDPLQEPTPERLEDLFPTEIVKPRRAKLPSPWRRHSQVIYSDEVAPSEETILSDDMAINEADLFWQPDGEAAKAAKKREERRKQKMEAQKSAAASDLTNSSNSDTSIQSESKSRTQRSLKKTSTQADTLAKGKIDIEAGLDESSLSLNTAAYLDSNETSIHDRSFDHKRPVSSSIHAHSEDHDPETPSSIFSEQKTPSRNFDTYSDDMTQMSESFYEEQTEISLTEDESVSEELSEQPSTNLIEETMLPPPRRQAIANTATQKQSYKHSFQAQPPPQATVPSQPAPSSWLTSLTSYIPLLGASTTTTTIPQQSDPAKHKPKAPLTLHHPWTSTHFHHLYPLYNRQLHHPHTYPFSSSSPAAAYLGACIPIAGWQKPFSANDCAVADAFMRVLEKRAKRDTWALVRGQAKIEIVDVLDALVRLWVGGCLRGEREVGVGGVSGVNLFTGRAWGGEVVREGRGVVGEGGREERRRGEKGCGICGRWESLCECWRDGVV